jgi:Domain of unknown function (DUF4173)
MATDALIEGRTSVARGAGRPIIRRAGVVVSTGGVLGVIGQLLFFEVGLGINFPLAVALLVAGGWLLRSRAAKPDRRDAWLAPAAVAFAAFAAIRADSTILALDILTSLALTGGALASFGGRTVVARSFDRLIQLGVGLLGWAAGGAIAALADAGGAMTSARSAARRAAPVIPVVRGLAIAAPLVLIFLALFSAADAVFAQMIDDLVGFELDVDDAPWRIGLAAGMAWLAAGGLALGASSPLPTAQTPATRRRRTLGATEVATVLVALNAVFIAFVAVQVAYLFGGLDTLRASGMTYADYARRGFFELVAVAALAGAVVVAADRIARHRGPELVAAAIGLVLLTGVVLVSAAMRLRMYQEVYGWTELRFYVLATIGLLAIVLVGLVATLATNRVRWIGHVVIAAALGVGFVLNVIGPVRFITDQNVARLLDPRLVPPNGSVGLDVSYVAGLGDDAIPALVRALPALEEQDAEFLRAQLDSRRRELGEEPGLAAWQAWNAARAAALDALEATR